MRLALVGLVLALLVAMLVGCRQTGGEATLAVPTQAPTPAPVPTATFAPDLIRRSVTAGTFYPGDPEELVSMVEGYMGGLAPTEGRPIALIVPHAGYVYSGPVAAYAYAELRGLDYEAVVLVGPNHYLRDLTGVAVYPGGAFETPLGLVPVHTELAQALLEANPNFEGDPALHRQEHALEAQLPFLQQVLPGTPIVPIILGRPTPENCHAVVDALVEVLQGRDVLIVASSDLSHYPAYEDALVVDREILAAIETMDVQHFRETIRMQMTQGIPNLQTTCCGEGAIAVVMELAPRLGADRVAVLYYANSGDVPIGDKRQVVGYGAVKFWKEE
jgi:AmmeMemoRadiSam system protein B